MQVTGWSNYNDIRNLRKDVCLQELGEIKLLFGNMLMSSEELTRFVKDKEIEYCLGFDDYGKASVSICSERHNHVKWYIDLK